MNIYIIFIVAVFVFSALLGFTFIPLILNFCKKRNLYDIPNGRKVHTCAVPRLGGICFLPSMFVSFVVALFILRGIDRTVTVNLWSLYFMAGSALIYITGLIDDVVGLKATTKFVAQIAASCFLPLSGLYVNNFYGFLGIHELPYWIGFALTVLVIVFIDNAMNLIDGIDGLAASLAIIPLMGFLIGFANKGIWIYSVLIAGMIGVLVAFLYYNMFGDEHKNRKIFMGDSGSLTIGFIISFFAVKYTIYNPNVMPYDSLCLITAFSYLVVPSFDVIRVFFVRIRHGQSPFQADKKHIHHKLLRLGLTQRQAWR